MNRRLQQKVLGVSLLTAVLTLALVPARTAVVFAQRAGSKEALTPTFWQRDPEAGFEDEGRMHCAPASVSNGLIYLSRALGMKDLVPGAGRREQIELIEELAEEFGTDPSIGGTNPDKILTGLQSFVKVRGYRFGRLEIKSWRPVSASNKQLKIGVKPDMPWMLGAANDRETVVIFNFGWYFETDQGYKRNGGHWVTVVGAGPGGEFTVHNPILTPREQSGRKSVELTLLDDDFTVLNGSKEVSMGGYYAGEGPGLPHGRNVAAILDAVIVFSLKK